jgi:TonB family protein
LIEEGAVRMLCAVLVTLMAGWTASAQAPLSKLPSASKLFENPLKPPLLPWERYLVYTAADGVTMPMLIKHGRIDHTALPRMANFQGHNVVEVVVGPDGNVHDVKLIQSLDPGLDRAAIQSAWESVFQPGTKDGRPVAVRTTIMAAWDMGSLGANQSRGNARRSHR